MLRRVNLDDEVYEILTGDLLDGKYIQNLKLSADHIAQAMGVSKTPVMFALKRMVQEGLLETNRSAGFYVRTLSTAENIALRNAMVFYDKAVLRECIQSSTISKEEIAELRRLADSTLQETDSISYFKRDLAFHMHLVGLGKNPFLSEAYRRLFLLLNLTRKQRDAEGKAEVASRPQQHITICDALEQRDWEKLQSVYLTHYLYDFEQDKEAPNKKVIAVLKNL